MIDSEQISRAVQHGEICEVRYLGKACEVRVSVGPILQYDSDADMLLLPGGLHIRRRDVISMVPVQTDSPDIVKTDS